MPDSTLTCPSCNATLRPKTALAAGTRIKCPKCLNVFAVPDEEAEVLEPEPRPARPRAAARQEEPEDDLEGGEILDDESAEDEPEDDRPVKRKKKKPQKKGIPLWVWLTGGAGVLLLLCCGGCGIGSLFIPKFDVQTGAESTSVSMTNFDKIKKGMTEAQVKDIMGAPTAAVTVVGIKGDSWNQGPDTITVSFSGDKAVSSSCHIGGVQKSGF